MQTSATCSSVSARKRRQRRFNQYRPQSLSNLRRASTGTRKQLGSWEGGSVCCAPVRFVVGQVANLPLLSGRLATCPTAERPRHGGRLAGCPTFNDTSYLKSRTCVVGASLPTTPPSWQAGRLVACSFLAPEPA